MPFDPMRPWASVPLADTPAPADTKPWEVAPLAPDQELTIPDQPVAAPVPRPLQGNESDLERIIRGASTRSREDLAGKLLTGLEYVDRPRAAVVGAIVAPEGQSASEFMKGLRGEQHPLMGDYIFQKLAEADQNPEAHPVLSNLRDFLGKQIVFRMPTEENWSPITAGQEPKESTIAAMSTIGGIVTDIMADPITYTGVGLTKKGVTELAATAAKREGRAITDPAMLKRLKALEDSGKMQEFRTTLEGQLAAGQKRVRIAAVPVPGVISSNIVKATNKFTQYIKSKPIGEAFDRAFSTKAGLEGDLSRFSELEERLNNLIVMGKDQAVRDGTQFARDIQKFADDLAGKTGKYVPPEDIGRIISEEAERAKRAAFVNNAPVEDVVKGPARLRRDWAARIRTWDAKLREYVRPELLDDHTRALVLSHPQVEKFITDLKSKNVQQLRDEINAGIHIADQGTSTQDVIDKMRAALTEARDAGVETVKNPITGRAMKRERLSTKVDKMEKAWAKQERIDYMVHAITPEAKAIIMSQERRAKLRGLATGRQYSVQHASTLQRRLANMSVAKINELAQAGKLPGYEGIRIQKFFYDDPAIQQTIRDMRHRKAMAIADFFEETKAQFGRSTQELRDEAIAGGAKKSISVEDSLPAGWSTVKNPKAASLLKGYAFPTEVAARLDAHYEALLDPKQTGAFLDMFDGVQNWWKAWTLGIFPSYHFRNAVGNVWNNFVTGLHDPAAYGVALDIQLGKKGAIRTADGRSIAYDEIKQHMEELGVRGRGFMGSDIEETLKSELGGGRWATLTRDSKLIHYGKKIATAVENNARMAKFIDELQKGRGFRDAAQATKRALFDYTDLTNFEKTTAKRLAPFYSWTRKNIPLQIASMLKSPGKFKAIDTIRQEVEANVQEPNEYALANWMMENYPVRVKIDETDGKPRYFMLGGWLPAADIWSMASNPPQTLLNLLTPIIKTPLEVATNKDFFTWQDIKHYDSETVSFLGDNFRISPVTKRVLSNIRLLAVADAMLPETYKGVTPQTVRDMTPDEKLLQFMTGVKLYGLDLEKQKSFNAQETQKRLKELGKYKAFGYLPQKQVPEDELKGLDEELQREIRKLISTYGPAPKQHPRSK
jgi:hypothetical protein